MDEKKTYVTTAKAGPRVAGRVIPWGGDEKKYAGADLVLSDREADYELQLGTIALKRVEPAPEAEARGKAKKPADAGGDGSNAG